MADALVTPAVGGTMWAATAATAVYCARKVREEKDDARVPLMGVLGAFIFATQMLNFSIPGTGSSGHLGGGLILAILLGPEAAFLVIASVLTVQALFFADGGLLALGCNIINLGLFPAFVAYPLFKRMVGEKWDNGRVFIASVLCAELGLLLGACGVVLETVLSGVSSLPFSAFILLMLPVHTAIGLVEGLVTGAVVLFVKRAQPELLRRGSVSRPPVGPASRKVLAVLAAAAVIAAGTLAWFASSDPDGLEWSIARITGSNEVAGSGSVVHEGAASIQEKTAVLPDYGFKGAAPVSTAGTVGAPTVDAGTSVAGLAGAGITLAAAAALGFILSRRRS